MRKDVRRFVDGHELSAALTKVLFELPPKIRGLPQTTYKNKILFIGISHRIEDGNKGQASDWIGEILCEDWLGRSGCTQLDSCSFTLTFRPCNRL